MPRFAVVEPTAETAPEGYGAGAIVYRVVSVFNGPRAEAKADAYAAMDPRYGVVRVVGMPRALVGYPIIGTPGCFTRLPYTRT